MNQHSYLTRIQDDTWVDLQTIKNLTSKSINTLLNEGCRMIRDEELRRISQQRKTRNTLQSMNTNSGW